MIKLLMLFIVFSPLWAESTGTTVDVPPTEEEIAYLAIDLIEEDTKIEKLRTALLSNATYFECIREELFEELTVLELCNEEYKKHKRQKRNYASVIPQGNVNNRIKRLKEELPVDFYQVEVSTPSIGDEFVIDGDTYEVIGITPTVAGSTSLVTGTTYHLPGSTSPIVIGEYDEKVGGWLTGFAGFIVTLILGMWVFLKKKKKE